MFSTVTADGWKESLLKVGVQMVDGDAVPYELLISVFLSSFSDTALR
jgi:hypothetical protein